MAGPGLVGERAEGVQGGADPAGGGAQLVGRLARALGVRAALAVQPQAAQEVRGLAVEVGGQHLRGRTGIQPGPGPRPRVRTGVPPGPGPRPRVRRRARIPQCRRAAHVPVPRLPPVPRFPELVRPVALPLRPVHHRGTGSGHPAGLVSDAEETGRPPGRLVMSLGHAGASGRQ